MNNTAILFVKTIPDVIKIVYNIKLKLKLVRTYKKLHVLIKKNFG